MRKLIQSITFLLLSFYTTAQIEPVRNYKIMILPGQYLLNDYNISFEKFFGRKTIGVYVGVKPSTSNEGKVHGAVTGMGSAYSSQNMRNQLSNAVTLVLTQSIILDLTGSQSSILMYNHFVDFGGLIKNTLRTPMLRDIDLKE